MQQIKRGDIYYADLNPYIGSEQGGVRPILIVQNDIGNKYSSTIIAAVITSQTKTELPTHVKIKGYGLNKDSTICLEQIRTIDKCRLREYVGRLDDELMEKVEDAIDISFGIQCKREGHAVADLMVKQVEFNGDTLLAVKDNETSKVHVAVYYVCRGLGLSDGQMKNERVRIQDDIVLSKGGRKIILPTNGGSQEVLCIEIDYLPLWLAKINVNIIQDKTVQDKLIEYQLKAKDVLSAAFLGQTQPQFNIPQTLPEALRFAADLAEENAKLLPKANSFDSFMNSEGNLTVEETAKTLNIKGIGRNNLFKILTIEKILFRKSGDYEAYQNYVDSGYFVHKQNPIKKGDVIEQRTQVFVTPKGLDWLSKKMKKRNYTN